MALATNLGFPRIGASRELKKALESFWSGNSGEADLAAAARTLRERHWTLQKDLGLDHIPSNDFSLYDQMLDTSLLLGAVPKRFRKISGLRRTFAMARGETSGAGVAPLEMTKWFDTNYHYLVPELEAGMTFELSSEKPFDDFREAWALGISTRPVLIGPVTYLALAKGALARDPDAAIEALLPVYEAALRKFAALGAHWVQMDEPAFALDLDDPARRRFERAYGRLKSAAGPVKLLVASYFGDYRGNLETAVALPVDALHLDGVRGDLDIDELLARLPSGMALSYGVVNGRNVWSADLDAALGRLQAAAGAIGKDRVFVAPSCSLLHVPVELAGEASLSAEVRPWLAFAREKIKEIAVLTKALNEGESSVREALDLNREAMASRRASPLSRNAAVRARTEEAKRTGPGSRAPFEERKRLQATHLRLPPFPTTTIGSFPQTQEIRAARRRFRTGSLSAEAYRTLMESEIDRAVDEQEKLGLDVLVHGEPERNDMVEYFAEGLRGFLITTNGWVQSYGSRCVKPPVIYGDVWRPGPMTLAWIGRARSRTKKPVKGMLTGPVTILHWSFVRDDQPRAETARQIALAIRDEVQDLEKDGVSVIQIDEAAIREGRPLRRSDRSVYDKWAVECFRFASGGVRPETQIHTHMCYSEFNDMISAIAAMDADVITIEASRSGLELLAALKEGGYPNDIGPGVYDIHSPRVPSEEEVARRIEEMLKVVPRERLWVNPDCGLKTRGWPEVRESLRNLVAAAKKAREVRSS